MRIATVLAVALLGTSSLAGTQHAQAAIEHYQLNIPRQSLDAALKDLAQQTGLQIGRFSAEIDGSAMVGPVLGDQTPAQALETLLHNTGLEYKVVSDTTIAVYNPKDATSAQFDVPPHGGEEGAGAEASSGSDSKEAGKKTSQSFRVAQVDQGSNSQSSSVANTNSTENAASQENVRSGALAEIVVTAQKRSERLQDVPISMSVVPGDELDRSTFSSVADLLNTLPGVSTYGFDSFGAGAVVTIRGVSASNGGFQGASTVAYYVDGVSFGFIRFAILPDPNLYDLQDIEALRGPQGTLYGANALNGAVLVNTHDPDLNNFDFKARALTSTTDTGGWNYSGDMAANIPIVDGELAMRVAVSDYHLSGWIDSPLGNNINSEDISNVRVKIKAQPTESLSFVLTGWHSQTDTNGPSEGLENGFFDQLHPDPNYQHLNVLSLKTNYDFSSFTVSSVTGYMKYANAGVLDLTGLVPPPPGLTAPLDLTSTVYSEEINLTSKSGGVWHWSAGALYRNDKDVTKEWENIYAPPQAPVPGTTLLLSNYSDTSKSAAVYGEIGRRFAKDFEWSLGLRYFHDDAADYENSFYSGETGPLTSVAATFHAVTPRALLQWFPNEDLTAYATYSQGFRSGLIQSDTIQHVLPDVPPSSPDKLTNYELGMKGTWLDRRVSYDLAVFYNYWAHIQQGIQLPYYVGGVQGGVATAVLNGRAASGVGTEVSLSARPVSGLELSAAFSWNNLHFDSNVYSGGALLFSAGDRPDFSPEYTGNLSAQYTFALAGSGLKGQFADSANYISKVTNTFSAVTPVTAPGDAMLTDKGSFSIIFPKRWTVTLFVDNAFNNRESPLSSIGPPFPNYDDRIRPRTIGLSADYKLD